MVDGFTAWMPLEKSNSGDFVGILSDTSLDRDDEFMTKELLDSWASETKVLPMLANHENKIEKLIGGWTEKQVITKGESNALVAKPFFLRSNPLGRQTEEMVNEALEKGLEVGISIGAIPKETVEKEIDGEKRKGYNKAEILEATVVPLQSNARSSFQRIAKQFDVNLKKDMEVNKMADEVQNLPEGVAEAQAEEPKVEEAPEEKPAEEVKEETPAEEEKEEETKEDKELKNEVAELKKQIADMKKKAVMVNAPTVEGPTVNMKKEDDTPWSIEKGLKDYYFGGK